jgi:uncharacterized Fe-S cluster protein YjdI
VTPAGKAYAGEQITVYFDGSRCRHFAECVRGLPIVFDTAARPWIQPGNADADSIAEVVRRCPSGALHYTAQAPEPPDVPTTVTVLDTGALVLRGDLEVRVGDDIVRDTRAALCGCGRTGHAPYCDASCES